MRDILFGLRFLGRSPGLAVFAILTLALGIGANTAVFSVVNAVLLRSFGYADPARLVQISGTNKQGQPAGVSIYDMTAFQQRAHSLQRIGTSRVQSFTLIGAREPENLFGQMVSPDCFKALDARPLVGRTFDDADFQSGAPPVAVVSHQVWQSSLDADPNVVGRRVLLNGAEHTIVGVMPPHFQFPHPAFRVWTPWRLGAEDLANHSVHNNTLVARLKPGVSREAAAAELKSLSAALAAEFPNTNTG